MNNEQKLKELFWKLFSYEFADDLKDASFFMEPLNMNARNYLLLFLQIEENFSVRFSNEAIDKKRINTFNLLLNEINESSIDKKYI